jgi:hypothetical protein
VSSKIAVLVGDWRCSRVFRASREGNIKNVNLQHVLDQPNEVEAKRDAVGNARGRRGDGQGMQ